jgi:hypothetical protein
MIGWIFRKIGWKSFAAGAATAVIGPSFARPVLVSLAKTGMSIQSAAAEAWEQTRQETAKIRAEAEASRAQGSVAGDVGAEIQKLRQEVEGLKTTLRDRAV